MNDIVGIYFFVGLGGLSLALGLFGDGFNFALAASGSRAEREQREQRHVSPVMLSPILFNSFGLMLIWLGLRLSFAWFVFAIVFVVLFHLFGLYLYGR